VKRLANEDRRAAEQLRIERLYHSESTALDALVDVLQALLLDDTESLGAPSLTGAEPTCFPRPHE
jgi:hypothetical protein